MCLGLLPQLSDFVAVLMVAVEIDAGRSVFSDVCVQAFPWTRRLHRSGDTILKRSNRNVVLKKLTHACEAFWRPLTLQNQIVQSMEQVDCF
jgi:hypothetical protein